MNHKRLKMKNVDEVLYRLNLNYTVKFNLGKSRERKE